MTRVCLAGVRLLSKIHDHSLVKLATRLTLWLIFGRKKTRLGPRLESREFKRVLSDAFPAWAG